MAAKKSANAKTTKLPAALKVEPYAAVVAASADAILAGNESHGLVVGWQAERGAFEHRATPHGEVPPQQLVLLPGGRFVQTWGNGTNHVPPYRPGIGLFGADGALLGFVEDEFDWEPRACAADTEGAVIALSSRKDAPNQEYAYRLSLWRIDDLIGGGRAFREIEGLAADGLAFTPDGRSVVLIHEAAELVIVSVETGGLERIAIDSVHESTCLSISDHGTICASGGAGGTTLLTLAGETLFCVKSPHRAQFGIVTPGGLVITACGAPQKHERHRYADGPAAAGGYVGVHDASGKLLHAQPRAKQKHVRAMALSPERAVVIGQDGFAELAAWPIR